jgi:hypothetical protein
LYPQFATKNLAGWTLGQFGKKLDGGWDLVISQLFFALGDDGVAAERLAIAHRHEGDRHLALFLVLRPDDGDLDDAGEMIDDFFDVGRIDILAPPNDHILLAIDDVGVPLCVPQT